MEISQGRFKAINHLDCVGLSSVSKVYILPFLKYNRPRLHLFCSAIKIVMMIMMIKQLYQHLVLSYKKSEGQEV